jgi:predicted metalloprotease with PDZ domain
MIKNIGIFFCGMSVVVLCLIVPEQASGDTVIKKDREKVKGVIVEEYKDRIVLSTMDGEQKIMKSDIDNISYDLEEQNLTRMGDLYQDRAMYQEAYYYYNQALKVNPNYKPAREGVDYSGSMLQQFSRKMKLEHINRMNEEKAWRSGVKIEEGDIADQVNKVLGFSIEPFGANFKVSEVRKASPASDAGLKEGDIIVALWGRMTGYTRPEDLMTKIMAAEVMEVRFTILRGIVINVPASGGSLSAMLGTDITYSETEGFEVTGVVPESEAWKKGVVEGDILVEIEGVSTRYMPLEELERSVEDKRGEPVSFSVKRDISIWKRFEKK